MSKPRPRSEPTSRRAVGLRRCAWAEGDELLRVYHDTEWGVPEWDSRALWEMLVLEGFQAGLSWTIILRKREGFRSAFQGFEPTTVASFGPSEVARLLADPGIVRSRAKVEATVDSARRFLALRESGLEFSQFVWDLVGGAPRQGTGRFIAKSRLSEEVSRALKARGFKFVGPVIVYAWMQAVGMVNDHVVGCYRRRPIRAMAKTRPVAR
jgi:DNA-3-methyladenine glycosylase I